MPLRILFIGDVVGAPGRKIVTQVLPRLIHRWELGLVVCNAENVAGGSGLTVRCYEELREAGVDVLTMGDHVYRKDEIYQVFEHSDRALKPANFPLDSPGPELAFVEARDGTPVAVFTVLGRTYMRPVDCPFRAADRVLERIGDGTRLIVVDLHAEATSDKQLLGRYLDGRVTAALGTHTHVTTADEQILKGGTAYQTDVGMTGGHDSILGRRYDRVLAATLSFVPCHFDVASGDPRLSATLVEAEPLTGKASFIQRVSIREDDVRRLLTDLAFESPRSAGSTEPLGEHQEPRDDPPHRP